MDAAGIKGARIHVERATTADYEKVLEDIAACLRTAGELKYRIVIHAEKERLKLLQPQLEAKARRKLRRLAQRLLKIDHELDGLIPK